MTREICSEDRYEAAFRLGSAALLVDSGEGRILEGNAAASELLGVPAPDLSGRSLAELGVAEGRLFRPGADPPAECSAEIRLVRRDGTLRHVRASARPLGAGTDSRYLVSLADLTDSRIAEEARLRSESTYRLIVDGASEVFYRVTSTDDPLRGTIEFVGEAVHQTTGYSAQQLRDDPELWVGLIHPEDLPALEASTRECVSGGRSLTRTFRIRDAEGRYRWMEDRVSPIADESGRIVGYQGVARDVTDRLQLEVQLQQSQRLESVGRLAAGIAHDFNTLLSVILATVDLHITEAPPGGTLRTDLEAVRRAGNRAAGLTRQLLAFSRKQVLRPTVLGLNAVVDGFLPIVRRLLEPNIEVEFEHADDLSPVLADPTQIEQLLLNLASNSRDAMPAGGRFAITTRNVVLGRDFTREHPQARPGPHVLLSVADTGVGMDEVTRTRIFEPFFTTKEPGIGTGLGMATVYGIVKQSGGHIWVYSEPDAGTRVDVYLPSSTVEAPPEGGAGKAPLRNQARKETILLVDDEPALLGVVKRLLQRLGYSVLTATDGAEALELLNGRSEPVDLLLTDVVMPDLSGPALAERVLAVSPSTRVLFVSGYADDDIVQRGIRARGFPLVNKPYDIDTLHRTVRDLLDATPAEARGRFTRD